MLKLCLKMKKLFSTELPLTLKTWKNFLNTLIDLTKTNNSTLLITCFSEKPILLGKNVPVKTELDSTLCLVLFKSLPQEEFFLPLMPKKFMNLPLSLKKVKIWELFHKSLSLNSWMLLIYTTISQLSNFLSKKES